MTMHMAQTSGRAGKGAKPYKGIGMEGVIARWYAKIREQDEALATTIRQVQERVAAGGRILEVAPGPGYLAIELAKLGTYQVVGLDISKTFVEMAQAKAKEAGVAVEFRQGNAADMPLAAGGRILEVAPGPGYLAIELAKLGTYQVVGLDISKTFVEMAQAKAKEAGVAVEFRQGNAADMPLAADSFDFIICRAAFKNFTEPVEAIREMYRVLKPGGRALIADLRRDASLEDINRHVGTMGLNWINRAMTKATFKYMLLKNAYTPAEMRQFVAQTDFSGCEIREDAVGMDIWLEK